VLETAPLQIQGAHSTAPRTVVKVKRSGATLQ
jgi:hypothetical protein